MASTKTRRSDERVPDGELCGRAPETIFPRNTNIHDVRFELTIISKTKSEGLRTYHINQVRWEYPPSPTSSRYNYHKSSTLPNSIQEQNSQTSVDIFSAENPHWYSVVVTVHLPNAAPCINSTVYKTPIWVSSKVMHQIFHQGFSRGASEGSPPPQTFASSKVPYLGFKRISDSWASFHCRDSSES